MKFARPSLSSQRQGFQLLRSYLCVLLTANQFGAFQGVDRNLFDMMSTVDFPGRRNLEL